MAPKKKTDDVADAKGKITKSARVVGEAAKNVSDMGSRLERLFTSDAHWGEIGQEVDDLDAEFGKEEDMMNTLKHKFEQGDVDVRVVQLGPNGSLVDVSVSDKDPRPDYASGIQAEGRINRD